MILRLKRAKGLLPGKLVQRLVRFRSGRIHAVVGDPQSGAAYSMFGGERWHEHFSRIYLQNGEVQKIRYGLHARNWQEKAISHTRRFGMAVVSELELPEDLQKIALRVPQFVPMSVDLGSSESAFRKQLSSSAQSDLRLINRSRFDYEVHQNAGWAAEFYHRFHEKGIVNRHGKEALVMPPREIAELVAHRGWEFVCVKRDDQCLAAVLSHLEPDGYRMARIGWLDANPALVKDGALSAVYWFAMRRARELGAQRVKLGGAPPYLEDGLFRYKAKWNASLDAFSPGFEVCHLLLDPAHPSARAMLAARSIIALSRDDQYVVYSGSHPESHKLSPLIRRGVARWYCPSEGNTPLMFDEVPCWNPEH